MKQMTKEELIEYFIEQLGDNEILGQVMTIEQIREKLQTIIKEVTYSDEIGSCAGHWKIENDGRGIVNFDLRKISIQEEKQTVVHELLHALSTTTVTNPRTADINEKCGILYLRKLYFEDDVYLSPIVKNMAINEGMTDFLAEQITGDKHNGYNAEKSIYKVLSIIIGQDTMMKKAFGEDVDILQNGLDIFKEEFIAKYGEKTGNELNERFKKVSTLSDQLLDFNRQNAIYGLNADGKKVQTKTKEEMLDTLGSMLGTILNLEHDLNKKIDIMIKLKKMCDYQDTDLSQIRTSMSENILWDLFLDDSIDYTQKLEMIRKIKEQGIEFQDEAIDDVLFSMEGSPELSIDEKIEAYIQLQKGKRLTTDRFYTIYDMYVKSGRIIVEKFPKEEFLKLALGVDDFGRRSPDISTIDKMNKMVNDCFYYKVGDCYAVSEKNNQKNTFLFDLDGKCLENRKLNFNVNSQTADHYLDNRFLSRKFGEDRIQTIYEQLKEKFEGYKEKSNGEYYNSSVTVIGKILRINYEYYIEEDEDEIDMCFVDFYSVNDDGTLELIPKR